jgi:hypothetical protein
MELLTAFTREYRAISTVALIAAFVVVVVAALSYLLLSAGGAVTISAATTLNVTKSASVLRIGNGTYAIELASAAPSRNVAYVYLDRLPALMNPMLNVTLYQGHSTKINAGTAFADIELQLTSAGSNAVTLVVTPISASLDIAPDSLYISTVHSSLQGLQQRTNVTASSVSTSVTVTSVQSTVATTTVNTTNATKSRVLAALQKSEYYPLMLNYSALYAETLSCTSAMYNTTYIRVKGIAPSGINTFENVSLFVPYALYSNISSAGAGAYSVVYYTKTRDPSYNKTPALTIGINASAETLLHTSLSGVFLGLDYTTLLNGYKVAASVGGACAIYVT